MLKKFLLFLLTGVLVFSELPWGVLETQAQHISDEEFEEIVSQELPIEEELVVPEEKPEEQPVMPEEEPEEESVVPEEGIEEEPVLPEEGAEEEPIVPEEGIEEEPVVPEEGAEEEPVVPEEKVEEEPVAPEEEAEEEETVVPEEKIEEEPVAPEEEAEEDQPVMPEEEVIEEEPEVPEEKAEEEKKEELSVQTDIVEKEATFNYAAEIGNVTLKIDSVDDSTIQLSWSMAEGAHGYELYRCTGEKEYELLALIEDPDAGSYKDENLTLGEDYTYKIVPYVIADEVVYQAETYAEASAKTVLAAVKLSSVTNVNYKTLKIIWNKVNGVDGYQIYRSDSSSGEYKRVKTITSGSTVSYKDSKVAPNKKQYYKVRAYRLVNGKKVYGAFSSVKNGKTMFTKTTGLKITASNYKTLKLTWKKVSGASKYQIYYSTSKNSGYKKLKTLTGTSYSWTKAVCGKNYYFKVRAIKSVNGENVYGDYSDIVSKKTKIGKTTVSAAKRTYNSIKITWKKVSGAQKYELYFATSQNGTYKKLKTTSTGTSYTHTGRTPGKTYYYKVRTIRQNSSAYSKVVSAKTSLGRITGLETERNSSGGYKISWKAADGAKSYKIYRSSEKYGTYTLIGSTTNTSYKDKKAGKATVYYKVRGYRDSLKTDYAGPVMASIKRIGLGVDVSEYQGKINWKAVEDDGIQFAMLRVVKGRVYDMKEDARFEEYYEGARDAGLSLGVYRYCYAMSTSEAREEAEKVLEVLDGRELEYPVVLDMEDPSLLRLSDYERSKIVLAFREVIEDAGYDFAMYANLDWVNNYLDMDRLEDVDLWLARWRPRVLGAGYTGDNNLIMWQYSSTGRVDGISGDVDLDVSYE